jgi:hypothetical protein
MLKQQQSPASGANFSPLQGVGNLMGRIGRGASNPFIRQHTHSTIHTQTAMKELLTQTTTKSERYRKEYPLNPHLPHSIQSNKSKSMNATSPEPSNRKNPKSHFFVPDHKKLTKNFDPRRTFWVNKACSVSKSLFSNSSVERDIRQAKTTQSFKQTQKFGGYNSTSMIVTAKDKRTNEERLEVIQVEHVMDSKRYGNNRDGTWEDAEDLNSRAHFGPNGCYGFKRFQSEPQINSELINGIIRNQIDKSAENTSQEQAKFEKRH